MKKRSAAIHVVLFVYVFVAATSSAALDGLVAVLLVASAAFAPIVWAVLFRERHAVVRIAPPIRIAVASPRSTIPPLFPFELITSSPDVPAPESRLS